MKKFNQWLEDVEQPKLPPPPNGGISSVPPDIAKDIKELHSKINELVKKLNLSSDENEDDKPLGSDKGMEFAMPNNNANLQMNNKPQ